MNQSRVSVGLTCADYLIIDDIDRMELKLFSHRIGINLGTWDLREGESSTFIYWWQLHPELSKLLGVDHYWLEGNFWLWCWSTTQDISQQISSDGSACCCCRDGFGCLEVKQVHHAATAGISTLAATVQRKKISRSLSLGTSILLLFLLLFLIIITWVTWITLFVPCGSPTNTCEEGISFF